MIYNSIVCNNSMKYYCPVSADSTYSLRYLKVVQDRGVRESEWKKPIGSLQYCEFCERVFPSQIFFPVKFWVEKVIFSLSSIQISSSKPKIHRKNGIA